MHEHVAYEHTTEIALDCSDTFEGLGPKLCVVCVVCIVCVVYGVCVVCVVSVMCAALPIAWYDVVLGFCPVGMPTIDVTTCVPWPARSGAPAQTGIKPRQTCMLPNQGGRGTELAS